MSVRRLSQGAGHYGRDLLVDLVAEGDVLVLGARSVGKSHLAGLVGPRAAVVDDAFARIRSGGEAALPRREGRQGRALLMTPYEWTWLLGRPEHAFLGETLDRWEVLHLAYDLEPARQVLQDMPDAPQRLQVCYHEFTQGPSRAAYRSFVPHALRALPADEVGAMADTLGLVRRMGGGLWKERHETSKLAGQGVLAFLADKGLPLAADPLTGLALGAGVLFAKAVSGNDRARPPDLAQASLRLARLTPPQQEEVEWRWGLAPRTLPTLLRAFQHLGERPDLLEDLEARVGGLERRVASLEAGVPKARAPACVAPLLPSHLSPRDPDAVGRFNRRPGPAHWRVLGDPDALRRDLVAEVTAALRSQEPGPRLVVLEGEMGAGKSVLARQALASLVRDGARAFEILQPTAGEAWAFVQDEAREGRVLALAEDAFGLAAAEESIAALDPAADLTVLVTTKVPPAALPLAEERVLRIPVRPPSPAEKARFAAALCPGPLTDAQRAVLADKDANTLLVVSVLATGEPPKAHVERSLRALAEKGTRADPLLDGCEHVFFCHQHGVELPAEVLARLDPATPAPKLTGNDWTRHLVFEGQRPATLRAHHPAYAQAGTSWFASNGRRPGPLLLERLALAVSPEEETERRFLALLLLRVLQAKAPAPTPGAREAWDGCAARAASISERLVWAHVYEAGAQPEQARRLRALARETPPHDAFEASLLAHLYGKGADAERGVALVARFLRASPAQPHAWAALARLLARSGGRPDETRRWALAELRRRAEDPSSAPAFVVAWLSLVASCAQDALPDAVRVTRAWLGRNPGAWSAWTALASALRGAHRPLWDQAEWTAGAMAAGVREGRASPAAVAAWMSLVAKAAPRREADLWTYVPAWLEAHEGDAQVREKWVSRVGSAAAPAEAKDAAFGAVSRWLDAHPEVISVWVAYLSALRKSGRRRLFTQESARAFRLHPTNPHVAGYHESSRPQATREMVEAARARASQDPGNRSARVQVGVLILKWPGREPADLEEAERLLAEEAGRGAPHDPVRRRAAYALADLLRRPDAPRQDIPRALAILDGLLRSPQAYGRASNLSLRGRIRWHAGKQRGAAPGTLEKAEADLRAAAAFARERGDAESPLLLDLGHFLLDVGAWDAARTRGGAEGAAEVFARGIACGGDTRLHRAGFAWALFNLGRTAEAKTAALEAEEEAKRIGVPITDVARGNLDRILAAP